MDRNFPGARRIRDMLATGTHVLIWVREGITLRRAGDFLPDGSYLAEISGGGVTLTVRVIVRLTRPGHPSPSVVAGDFVPPDIAAGGPRCCDSDARLDGDLVGVGFHGDLGGLAGVGQADLDLLPADHDRPAHRDPPCHHQRFGKARRLRGSGAGSAARTLPFGGLGR